MAEARMARAAYSVGAMSQRLRWWFDAYFVGWIVGCIGAAVAHLFRNEEEATNSNWAHSPGWQREIGLFNLAIAVILMQVLIRRDDDSRRIMARTAVLLALMLGTNHVVALARDGAGSDRLHVTALGLNVLSGTVSAVLLAVDHRGRGAAQARVRGRVGSQDFDR